MPYSPGFFPVPAVKGAIETLISNLLENNIEEDRQIRLTVYSVYDAEAERIVKYKNVDFYWTHPDKIQCKISHFLFWHYVQFCIP